MSEAMKAHAREEKERHLNMVLSELYPVVEDRLTEGVIVPSMIAGLVQIAKQVAMQHAKIVDDGSFDDFFAACVKDILDGGDGLQVGERYST